MQTLLPTCNKSLSLLNASPPLSSTATTICCRTLSNFPKSPCFHSFPTFGSPKTSSLLKIFIARGNTCVSFFSQSGDFSNTQFPENVEDERIQEVEELELLNKPSPVVMDDVLAVEVDKEPENPDKDEAMVPFLKFFKPRDSLEDVEVEKSDLGVREERRDGENVEKEDKKVSVEYYEPKPGDCVVGVVVSGNENKLDVTVGADLLGTMLTKEVLPLYEGELEYLLCDLKRDAEEFLVKGKMGIVKDEAAVSGGLGPGKPVVETGTVLFAEVLGRTLSGRPLLSTRRLFQRMAWHRVRQIKELNEPIEVKITEWNTGGLLTRIEGLRAFLPRAELMNRVNNFKELKENVGRCKNVLITRINEANNDLILSEREAWEMLYLREGTLLEGTVKKILSYGAQVQIGETNRSGLLHISNISKSRINAVSDLLQVGEKVKVLVVKSMLSYKISLSIADLESEPGLFTTNKEKVFAEAEDMAKKYRQKLPAAQTAQKLESQPSNSQHFNNEETLFANWKWFKFERE